LQDGGLVAQDQDLGGLPRLLTLRQAAAMRATRVISRKTNRRHMIGDHHGQTAEAQLCWSEPWTGFSARTGANDKPAHSHGRV
jgi:hypothetical protein